MVSFPPVSPPRPYTPPLLTHTRHMPSPSHSSRFYHPHNIRLRGNSSKTLISSCLQHLLPFFSNFYLEAHCNTDRNVGISRVPHKALFDLRACVTVGTNLRRKQSDDKVPSLMFTYFIKKKKVLNFKVNGLYF